MTPPEPTHTAGRSPADATPRLAALLRGLGRRLSRLVWMYGLGTVVAATAAWLTFAFFADYVLRVPTWVRVAHLGVLLALPTWLLWTRLVRPLGRRPDHAGLSVLLERQQPDAEELLVSAVQLQRRADGDAELVRRVFERAEAKAAQLSPDGVFDERGPWKRFGLGVAGAALVACFAAWQPLLSKTFTARLFLAGTPWPQRTHLALSVPLAPEKGYVEIGEDEILVTVARGTDVPVLVRAEGRVPDEVTLHLASGERLKLPAGPDGSFRTVLRSAQSDAELYATGGDDQLGRPRVVVSVLEPPDVSGLAVRIEPPPYTGLVARTVFDRDIEVVAGSHLRIHVRTTPPGARGLVRLLPADRTIELLAAPFPARDDELAPEIESGLAFELDPGETLRYRFELEDDSGLSNPDPGLFAVRVVPDRAPEVDVFAPGRAEFESVLGGALPLRARVHDDYGVARLELAVRGVDETEAAARTRALEYQPLDAGLEERGTTIGVATMFDIATVDPGERVWVEGDQLELVVRATDNRPSGEPTAAGELAPGTGVASPVRVRIVSTDDYLRRVQERLTRLRGLVGEVEALQREKRLRVRELLTALESDEVGADADDPESAAQSASGLAAALSGQRRVAGQVSDVARELAGILEGVLYARLDEKGQPALTRLDELSRVRGLAAGREFQVETWRALAAAWSGGQLGAPVLAGQLFDLLSRALAIDEQDMGPGAAALEAALGERTLEGLHDQLTQALAHQDRALVHIEELLLRLTEWDDFQSILTLTRDILNRQRAVYDRTKNTSGGK